MNNQKDVVYNPDKKQLEDRLYDQGFSNYTLPSVARPKNALSHGQPLTARLYSLNNHLIKEVKQPQTSILFNTPEQANISPAEFDRNRNEKVVLKPGQLTVLPPISTLSQGSENLSGLNKNGQAQLQKEVLKALVSRPDGDSKTVSKPVGQQDQNDPRSDIASIESKEVERVNLVLNKLRESFLERTKFYNANDPKSVADLRPSKPKDCQGGSKGGATCGLPKTETEGQCGRKGQMELDLYINLIMKNSPNIDEFVYLVRNPESDDPYDLVLKNYFQLNSQKRKGGKSRPVQQGTRVGPEEVKDDRKGEDYYTVSIKGLCHFKEGKPVEFIGLVEWLKERETYDKIKHLAFFANFRKWKTLKMWSKNHNCFKQKVARKSLQNKLLINYPELREAILQAREALYGMANLKFLDLNAIRENQNEASDIGRFIARQEVKAQQTQALIQSYSKDVHLIVSSAIDARLETFRNHVTQNTENENFRKNASAPKNDGNQLFGVAENPYEALSFPESMPYDKRSILRKECYRFVRFSFFVDFLVQDALRSIYVRSLRLFVEEIEELALQNEPVVLREQEKGKQGVFKDPMFQLQLVADLDYEGRAGELEVVVEEVPDYKFPQAGEDDLKPEDFADYDLLAYPFAISYDVVEDFNEHQKKFCEYCEPRTFVRRRVANIARVALSLSPSLEDIRDSLDRILANGLSCLQAFDSFVQHPNMKKYSAILEEWEEHEDNRHAEFENTLLNPEDCIDVEEKGAIERTLKALFEQQFLAAVDYLAEFRQYLQVDWEYRKLDTALLISPKLARPGLTLNAVFSLLEHHRTSFENQIPYQADIGIFRVVSRALKAELAERPKQLKEQVSSRLLEELQDRVRLLRDWFDESSQRLKLNTTDIEVFVLQSRNLKEVERHLGYHKDFLKTTKEVIETVRRFQIEIKKDFGSMFAEVRNLELGLAGQLVQVNDNIVKNQEIFSLDIRETATPALLKECQALEDRLTDPRYFNINSTNVIEELKAFQTKIDEAKTKADKLNSFEAVLGLPRTRFDVIKGLQDMAAVRLLLWTSFKEWFEQVEGFRQSPFNEIRVEEIQEFVEKYQRNLAKCRKQVPPGNEIVARLDTEIKGFSAMLPIVLALRNPKLRPSHMAEIQAETRIAFNLDEMRLQDLLREEILEQQAVILGISVQVTQEANLRLQLNEIEEKFNGLVFPVTNFKEDSPKDSTYILEDTEPMMAEIDRLIMLINGVYGSRYLKEHKKAAADKRKEILTLQEMMVEWIKFQKSYVYLESIFSQAEIKKPLQLEAKEFEDSVNKVYKQNAKKISTVQYVAQLARNKHLEQYLATFRKQNEVLHELNKKLNNFLDQKREAFPRFYFVSNDELVFILANNDSPAAVQSFMGKLFENVHRVDFGPDPRSVTIYGLVAREGETLPLKLPVSIKGDCVEKWMKKLEESMLDAVFRTVKEGFSTYADLSRQDWYLRTSAQGLSVISQLAWTMSIEDVLKNLERDEDENADMTDVLADTQKNLETLTGLVRENLSAHQRLALVAVITTEVHNRDVIELLVQREVSSRKDFLWKQQLRCYFEEGSDFRTSISIMQIEARQKYGFEYYGPASRIVVTPLTERCWITITSALQMSLGAAPAGPAGTGKTESVKDLAKSLARFCIVFNCSDQIDYLMMEKLFRGIIKQGAWTCLDEFNRIDIEVLSVVAQQLLEMRLALLSLKNEEEFTFCSAKCRLNDTCGVFITMNPGYAGRTELPENLKSLFRPIAMMIPDYTLISQILLFAEGFLESKLLAAKMIKLYKLASEQLSQQRHYDFGMRAVKCVLEMSGKLKREQPTENEQVLLIQALRDSNLPKFLRDDVPLFEALLNDLFPTMRVSQVGNPQLQLEFDKDLATNCLVNSPAFNQKLLQLSSTLNVRFGTIVVGHALNGKTALISTLKNAINALAASTDPNVAKDFRPVSCVTINPKSVTMGELYGEENALTKDWADGIASFYIRQATNATDGEQKWICFDGPVDSLWIENMNSVLDDSRLLCLANGQRIRLRQDMRILFEVDLLDEASPATISRCGMVYIAEQVLGWQSLLKAWLCRLGEKKNADGLSFLSADCRNVVESLFANNLESLVEAAKAQSAPVEMVVFQNIKSALGYFECLLTEDFGFRPAGTDEYKSRYVMAAFIMAVAWAFTGQLQDKEAERVDGLLKKKFPTYNFPNDLVINCFLDPDSLELRLYSEVLEACEIELAVPFWDILIPTVDTVKITAMARLLLRNRHHVFLTGSTGTGKSVLVSSLVRGLLASNGFDAFRYSFSARTNSKDLQESLMSSLFLLSQKSRGARFGRQNLVVIDDVNMPAKEQFGAQPPIELLRQLVDKAYLYDRKEMHKIAVQDSLLLCVGAPPEGGRNVLSRRFVRHFDMLCFPKARSQTILRIFSTIMANFLFEFEESVRAVAKSLVSASIALYEKILTDKLPTPSKFFYTFNLRDLSKTFMGVMKANRQVVREGRHIVRLWAHETYRVFADRLNCQEDRDWFDVTLRAIADSTLGTKGEDVRLRDLLFTDLFTAAEDEVVYEEVLDHKRLVKVLEDGCEEFNEGTTAKMSLVFFKDATAHVLRLHRVLRQSRGSAMLVGVGGLGKTCVTRIASYLTDYQLISIEEAKGAVGDKFKEWLRKEVLLRCAGPEAELTGRSTTFMVGESFVKDESLFEDINNLLNSGEVPNIFPKDEREKLEKGLLDLFSEGQVAVDPADMWKAFVERVRDNLHIVLCMSPVGNTLRVRCRRFPALVDCTTIDWFENWPGEAIESVAEKLIEGCGFENQGDLARLFKEFHDCSLDESQRFTKDTGRCFFITPKLALDNIALFVRLHRLKHEALQRSKDVFTRGSVKLDEMTEVVKELRVRLVEAQPLLEEQRVLADQKLVELEASASVANEKKERVEQETSVIQVKTEQIELINNQAMAQLNESMPTIVKAEQEVRNIDKKELSTLRHLTTPPAMIEFIFSTVCLVLEEKYVSWRQTGIKLLNDLNKFIELLVDKIDRIKTQGSSVVSQTVVSSLAKNLKNDFFSEAKLESNVIARPLGIWCKAIYDFTVLKRQIEPLEKNAKEMSEKLAESQREYDVMAQELAVCKASFQVTQDEFNRMETRKKELENTIEQTRLKLGRAEKLTSLLADEGERWRNTIGELGRSELTLMGDVFLSAAFVSYMCPLTGLFRGRLLGRWKEGLAGRLSCSEDFSFLTAAGDPLVLKDWCAAGLPSDEVSQCSALAATLSNKWPFFIDPQMQAVIWLKKAFEADLVVLSRDSDRRTLIEKVRLAVANGVPLLVEDLREDFDPLLDPLVCHSEFLNPADQRRLIRFNDDDLDFHPSFRLFLSSKMANPSLLPEVFIKTNVVNFTVNRLGLEDQLLAELMKLEKPEVEETKNENIEKIGMLKKKMIEVERQILNLLAECTKSPVEDESLVQTLEVSKMTVREIREKMTQVTEIFRVINETREGYRFIAARGAVLYYVVADLGQIDPMYQYSLQYIAKLFRTAVSGTRETDPVLRKEELAAGVTRAVFKNVSRGLFEQHKTIFSFLIAANLQASSGQLPMRKLEVFLKGPGLVDRKAFPPSPDPKLLGEEAWDLMCVLGGAFRDSWGLLFDDIIANLSFWRSVARIEDLLTAELPEALHTALGHFDRLLLVKCLSPERLYQAMSSFIRLTMGPFYVDSLKWDVEEVFDDSDCTTPLIFIISQGSDPSAMIKGLGEKKGFRIYDKLHPISLGQGQGRRAARLIEDSVAEGGWVLLENCHLARTWMQDLEAIVADLQSGRREVHPDFRLFITSMPAAYFSVAILQNGVKVTTEPPRGIRANVVRALSALPADYFEQYEFKGAITKLTIGLCLFHAILRERRKFGPVGWNIRYEFNDSDIQAATSIHQDFLAKVSRKEDIPWDSLSLLVGHITYGGRITDDLDRRLLMTLLGKFYAEQILDDRYKFCALDEYRIPKISGMEAALFFAESLPGTDDPEVFGFHRNASITFQTGEVARLIETIVSVLPKDSSASKAEDSSTSKVLELVQLFLGPDGLPPLLQTDKGDKELFRVELNGLIPSLSTVLLQEVHRFNKLLGKIRVSLGELSLAIQGKNVMSAELDELFNHLLLNRVPAMWAAVAYPSLKPLASWFKDLCLRVAFMNSWLLEGSPKFYWLPGFFFPQGFLTAVLQTHARKAAAPIDRFSFTFKVSDFEASSTSIDPLEDGVYVSGLFLEAACWDKKRRLLVDQQPNDLYFAMPLVAFVPKETNDLKGSWYSCPLYKTLNRAGTLSTTGQSTNFILEVQLPCDKQSDFWVLRGVAMFTMLNT